MFELVRGVIAAINTDPLAYVNGEVAMDGIDANGITTDPTILNLANSWFYLLEVVGLVGVVISLIICGYKLIFYKGDPRDFSTVKKELVARMIIPIGIFSFIGIAGVIFHVANSIGG